ncbi:mucin-19-like [Chelonus insularis]|uniref:mucin-19-like n=1 Tax=Chelonus insularis TaxID=460826 RepID=UPI00158ABCA1|nr:mucin-19-like [Chelonus insularis]
MKYLIVLAAVASAVSAAPSSLLHGLGLAGPHLGAGAALAGPVVGHAGLSGPVVGPAHVSGAVAGSAVVSGSVAGPSAVIGSTAGATLVSEPSLGLSAWDLGWHNGPGAVVASGLVGPAALHGGHGSVVVAGPDGASISTHGLGHGAVIAGAHGHLAHCSLLLADTNTLRAHQTYISIMKFAIVLAAALIVAISASPERQRRSLGWGWGHNGVVLGGLGWAPALGVHGSALVGPVSPSVAVVGPAAGSAAVVGPVGGSAAVVGPHAGSAAVVGPSGGHTAVVGPSAGHAAIVGGHPGAAVVAGPAGLISAGGLWH